MGSGAVDSSQWLSVKEETIFLHDGLIRVTDLAELPSEIGVSEQGDTEQEVGEIPHTQRVIYKYKYKYILYIYYIETHTVMIRRSFCICFSVKCVFTVSCNTPSVITIHSANVCKFPCPACY